MKLLQKINFVTRFYKGSKRYFFSAIGFPPHIREDVTAVYNFCRFIDDSIDEPDKTEYTFEVITSEYKKALISGKSDIPLITEFVRIKKDKDIKDEWVDALFSSMLMDNNGREYDSLEDTLDYTYGVAEVIGLFMCKVLNLPNEAHKTAKYLGRSAQWINFIRDINEDLHLGRQYFPIADLEKFGLDNLKYETVRKKPDQFKGFMELQFSRFEEWVEIGEKGYEYIPNKFKRPIQYATRLDKWKLKVIRKNPYIVYTKKVDPGFIELITYLLEIYIPKKHMPKIILGEHSSS
jgi:phytoene synthase